MNVPGITYNNNPPSSPIGYPPFYRYSMMQPMFYNGGIPMALHPSLSMMPGNQLAGLEETKNKNTLNKMAVVGVSLIILGTLI